MPLPAAICHSPAGRTGEHFRSVTAKDGARCTATIMRRSPPSSCCWSGLGVLSRLLLLRGGTAAPALPRADICPGGTLPGSGDIGQYTMPTGVHNGGYAEVSCGERYERTVGHTVKRCDTSKYPEPWQPLDGGEALVCVPKGKGPGCSGSPDPSKHYANRTLLSRESLDVTCADGYHIVTPVGTSHYECEGSGWKHVNDIPEHQPLVCTDEPGANYCTGPPGEHFRNVTAKNGGYVVAACEDGYVGTGSSVFVCRANSEDVWVAAPDAPNTLVCTPPTCRAPPAEHTQGKCNGTQVGQPCRAECANGYTPQGDPTYTCGEDGAWTGGSLRCLKSCTLPQSLPRNWHAVPLEGDQVACVAGQALAAGKKCTIGCQAGYSQETDSTSYVFECGMESQLVRPRTDCQLCPRNTFNPTPGKSTCKACGDHCTSKRGSVRCNCTAPAPCNGVDCGHGSCQPLGNTSHTCECEDGWRQEDFNEGPCNHPTGCDDGPCQHGGTCVANNTGGFACHCVGPTWKWGGKTCTEPMGCHSEPCGAHGQCTADRVTGDGFNCSCTEGWSGKNCQNELPRPAPEPEPDADIQCPDDTCGHGQCIAVEESGFKCMCCGFSLGWSSCDANNTFTLGWTGQECDQLDWKTLLLLGTALVILVCLVYLCCRKCRSKAPRNRSQGTLLRESILGGPDKMPERKLAELDVPSRTERNRMTGLPVQNTELHPRPRVNDEGTVNVVFRNDHLRELQPREWRCRRQLLGTGSFGKVYEVTWRGQKVAVKQIELAVCTATKAGREREVLQQKLGKIVDDFVTEVGVYCDIGHPNLVRMVGYATTPDLLIVQELMLGRSINMQLYEEDWQPSPEHIRKIALDVARGMLHLHSFPIIHCDLKSSNLMLAVHPQEFVLNATTLDTKPLAKITDFGLSRDKKVNSVKQTLTMTAVGKGTTLWMAPELLLKKKYNEKIDVYSYAMCILELVSRKLPWADCEFPPAMGHPGNTRELEPQLERAEPPIAKMARECWAREPMERPSFPQIVMRLEALMSISHQLPPTAPAPVPVARPEPTPPPGPPMGRQTFVRSKVDMSTDADRDTWNEVRARVAESLPEYSVARIERLQNVELWRQYSLFCFNLEHAGARLGQGVNERRLFHWTQPKYFDLISGEEGSGFETRLARGGEYGNGSYFAQHAIYPLAFRTNSYRDRKEKAVDWSVPQETGTTIRLLWARVALGNCYDFGARCASNRGDAAAKAVGEQPRLYGDWPMDGHPTDPKKGHRRRPPPLERPTWTGRPRARTDTECTGRTYDSVSGTEANLEWTGNPRLVDRGAEFGRQFVTFTPWQAYPELVVYLEKRDAELEPEPEPEAESHTSIGGSE